MPRGKPKGHEVALATKKNLKPAPGLERVDSVPIVKTAMKMLTAHKSTKGQKEAILHIKPFLSISKRKTQLLQLTQGNFYKKPYLNKKASQNHLDDFLEI